MNRQVLPKHAIDSALQPETGELEEWMEAESEVLEPEVHRWNEPSVRIQTAADEAGNHHPRPAKIRRRRGR